MAELKGLPQDYQEKLREWKQKFKDKWDYNKKLIVFGDANGNIYTPSTTTSTTTTTPSPTIKPITTKNPDGSTWGPNPVANITLDPQKDTSVSQADTTDVVKIALITFGAIAGVILLIAIIVRLCRGAGPKRDKRISLRRPLQPEVEDHIYAEIEPLQAQRSESPSGSSSGAVALPVKKDHRKKSHARALSSRVLRFFNRDHIDSEDHSGIATVSFSRNAQHASISNEAPDLPGRNVANGKNRRKGRAVTRGESTASQRPLLDGDSISSSRRSSDGAEMRSNIYNPLLRNSQNRESGPYEHLTGKLGETGERASAASIPEEPPHDYFTLAAEKKAEDAAEAGTAKQEATRAISTIQESDEEVDTTVKAHDYFILEPHEREDLGNDSCNGPHSPSKSNRSVSPSKSNPASPSKDKPVARPRVTKSGSANCSADSDDGIGVEAVEDTDGQKSNDPNSGADDSAEIAKSNGDAADDADDLYVLGKLGEAPEPPPEVKMDDEYMTPAEAGPKPDYVDVYPNPPPRSSSLNTADVEGRDHTVKKDGVEKDEKKIQALKFNSPKKESLKLKTSTETDV